MQLEEKGGVVGFYLCVILDTHHKHRKRTSIKLLLFVLALPKYIPSAIYTRSNTHRQLAYIELEATRSIDYTNSRKFLMHQ